MAENIRQFAKLQVLQYQQIAIAPQNIQNPRFRNTPVSGHRGIIGPVHPLPQFSLQRIGWCGRTGFAHSRLRNLRQHPTRAEHGEVDVALIGRQKLRYRMKLSRIGNM
ncbi:hypothetical protein BZL41_25545 [Pseudomonas sp. PIC25]|nr:hypothetical protein BZL41_25545 [Pseudomonas sp. PIC25]